jgi:anti-sigma regulatory factor (Ser/Thr protein kinase)
MNENGDPIETISIRSDPAELESVRRRVERFALEAGFDAEQAGHVMLAVDESLTNIIRHAYRGVTDRPIELEMSNRAGELQVRIRDHGRWTDPERFEGRDLDDPRPGGLGMHIMRKCMDDVQYLPAEDGGTITIMRKHCAGNEGTPT